MVVIASVRATDFYGMSILAKEIQYSVINMTWFVVLAKGLPYHKRVDR